MYLLTKSVNSLYLPYYCLSYITPLCLFTCIIFKMLANFTSDHITIPLNGKQVMIGHRSTMTRQFILYLSNLFYISLGLYMHMYSLNIFPSEYIVLMDTINI
ncbi:hypothetical protein MSKOL_0605 [Methanosarcina sp. Kolksee]|nr:hypothetical protein MSKOL_0605 [Methanosarcina sp. Kolksee]